MRIVRTKLTFAHVAGKAVVKSKRKNGVNWDDIGDVMLAAVIILVSSLFVFVFSSSVFAPRK